jgi:Na+-driven multidrug efflux pump
MNAVKKIVGLVCMLAGLALMIGLPYQTIRKLTSDTASAEDYVFWLVIVVIFFPITAGLALFGRYAWQGEYDKN